MLQCTCYQIIINLKGSVIEEMDKEWLRREVKSWEREGIVKPAQSKAILAKYKDRTLGLTKKTSADESKHSKLIAIVSILGAILIGIGAILFVASNWQEIPKFFKLALLFGATFGLYFAGWRLQCDKSTHPKIGQALVFLGSIFVGVTIFLAAQIFNINANTHWLMLLWFLAVAPVSYGFHSKPTLVLLQLLFVGWIAAFLEGGNEFFSVLEGFVEGYGVFLFYGLTLYGVGYLHQKTKFSNFKTTYQGFGLFFALTLLYILVVSEFEAINQINVHWMFWFFLATSLLTTLSSVAFLIKENGAKHEFVLNLLIFLSAIGAWLLSRTYESIPYDLESTLLVIFIGYIVVFFGITLLTVLSGYYQEVPAFINLGLLFFVLCVGYIYFTTIFEYLPRSLALIIGGIILLGGGWYLEKKRRSIIAEIT